MSTKKTAQSQEQHDVVDLDAEESVDERVSELLALQAGAIMSCRASSSPDNRKGTCQSPRLSAKSDKSAGSDNVMNSTSGRQLPKPTGNRLTFADAVVVAPTPEPGAESMGQGEGTKPKEQAI